MICNPPYQLGVSTFTVADVVHAANTILYGPNNPAPMVAPTYRGGYSTVPTFSATVMCYAQAAVNSALQMIVERNKRRAAQGLLPLVPLSHWFNFNVDADLQSWWKNSESWWLFGNGGYCHGDLNNPVRIGYWCADNHIAADYYGGDIALSAQQLLNDDVTALDPTKVFEPLKSPDGILPYTPGRLAQANLTDTYHALMGTEENALAVLAQSQSPETVAMISTTQTVTDPIGRLTTGALVQNQLTGALVNPLAPNLVSNPGVPANITAGTAGAGAAAATPTAAPATSNATPLIGLVIAVIPFLLPGNK